METLDELDGFFFSFCLLETKYRDIADGNLTLSVKRKVALEASDTKYRDIADGNLVNDGVYHHISESQIPSTAI